jgi:hypothetical protein
MPPSAFRNQILRSMSGISTYPPVSTACRFVGTGLPSLQWTHPDSSRELDRNAPDISRGRRYCRSRSGNPVDCMRAPKSSGQHLRQKLWKLFTTSIAQIPVPQPRTRVFPGSRIICALNSSPSSRSKNSWCIMLRQSSSCPSSENGYLPLSMYVLS